MTTRRDAATVSGHILWEHDGLAVASDGRVLVALCSGEVVCVGKAKESQ